MKTVLKRAKKKVAATRRDRGDEATAVDVNLFKTIGMYRLLSERNGAGRTALKALLSFTCAVLAVQPIGMYYTANELQRFAFVAPVLFLGLMNVYKGYVLVTNADRIRELLDAGRHAFTACGARDPSRTRDCGATLRVLLRAFAAYSYSTVFVYACGVFVMDEYVPLVGPDGAVTDYRANFANLWYPVPASVYDPALWPLFFASELVIYGTCLFFWVPFDCLAVTACFVINAQLRTVSAGFAALGHRRRQFPTDFSDPLVTFTDFGTISDDEHLKHYNELIVHIKDSQNVIKMIYWMGIAMVYVTIYSGLYRKFDDFMDIVRPAVLGHISYSSNSIVFLTFLSLLAYLMGQSIFTMSFLKMTTGLLVAVLQIYLFCYSFSYMEDAKSEMNFGVYSSDWTVMNMKFKKTLLIAMKMNSAHTRIMRFSPKSIVNLELFARVINMAYSVVPVLLNARSLQQR